MEIIEFTKDQRAFIERMRLPFALCQFLDKGVVTLAVSDGFCELFGYKDREQAYSDMNQNMFKNVHPEDTAGFTNAVIRFGTQGGRLDVIYRTRKTACPGYKIIHLIGEHVNTDDGLRMAQLWFMEEGDYQEKSGADLKKTVSKVFRQENIEKAARYDYLTGLPNMSFFFELAEVGRKTILDQGGLPALLYIDLSGMKHYNHKYCYLVPLSHCVRCSRSFQFVTQMLKLIVFPKRSITKLLLIISIVKYLKDKENTTLSLILNHLVCLMKSLV